MRFLRDIFARYSKRHEMDVPLADLAHLVAPLHGLAKFDPSPKTVGVGLGILHDWVRIGFHGETNKGTHATALLVTLRQAGDTLGRTPQTPHSKSVSLSREDMAILRGTYWQITAAATGLRAAAKILSKTPEMRLFLDRDGKRKAMLDFSNVIPIYNRPQESYEDAADKLDEIRQRFDSFFVNRNLRPAHDGQISHKARHAPLYD